MQKMDMIAVNSSVKLPPILMGLKRRRRGDWSVLFFYLFSSLGGVLSVYSYTLLLSRRGVGCIFYEMITGRPLFPGSTVEDELHLIFRILGEQQDCTGSTPTELTWPGITISEEFKTYKFPRYHAEPLVNHAPRIDSDGGMTLSFMHYSVIHILCEGHPAPERPREEVFNLPRISTSREKEPIPGLRVTASPPLPQAELPIPFWFLQREM
ncbi:unnamed protein product [Coregonus sp. 'balchen']|nr:unnamed protein product [Coregonus sp. 'balchen']